jgi:hypothetical protein
MRKGAAILLLGLLVCTAAFSGFYYFETAACRGMMREARPELAWLKTEFKLSVAEYARIVQLHEAYMPQCRERCRRIEEQNQKVQALLAQANTVTPQLQSLLAERAQTRAECEAAMLKHFLEVSQTMPPAQGRRYLAWVEGQSGLWGQGMEGRHRAEPEHGAPDSNRAAGANSTPPDPQHGMEMPSK